MSLFSVTVTEKASKPYAKTILLNSAKVGDFKLSGTGTEFIYYTRQDGKKRRVVYKTATAPAAFLALVTEAAGDRWVSLTVLTTTNYGLKKAVNEARYLDLDRWIEGYDNSDGETSTVTFDRGAFEEVELTIDNTITEIDAAAAGS